MDNCSDRSLLSTLISYLHIGSKQSWHHAMQLSRQPVVDNVIEKSKKFPVCIHARPTTMRKLCMCAVDDEASSAPACCPFAANFVENVIFCHKQESSRLLSHQTCFSQKSNYQLASKVECFISFEALKNLEKLERKRKVVLHTPSNNSWKVQTYSNIARISKQSRSFPCCWVKSFCKGELHLKRAAILLDDIRRSNRAFSKLISRPYCVIFRAFT